MNFVCSLYRVPIDEYLPLARAAEEAGYEAITLSDHLVHVESIQSRFPYAKDGERPWGAEDDYPDVWVATAMMAAVTQRLRFLQAIYVLPAREPYSVAKSLGTLARMSGHRVSLGFGVGWMREEFMLTGQSFEARGRRTEEMITLMKKLWTGQPIDHRGEFYEVEGVQMRPAVAGPIPILCSGESDRALRRAARIGDGWIPPISVATLSDLRDRIEQLDAYRMEAARSEMPFSVYWTPMAEYTADEYREIERIGVSHVFVAPWRFEEAASLPLEEKCALLRAFGRAMIDPERVR